MDHCNYLLYSIPKYQRDKLQLIQNTATHLVMGLKRSDHVRPILKNLHWLPVEERIEFKNFLITYKTIYGQTADYLKPLIEMYQPSQTLRSVSRSLFCPQKAKTENYGCRAFLLWRQNCGTPQGSKLATNWSHMRLDFWLCA